MRPLIFVALLAVVTVADAAVARAAETPKRTGAVATAAEPNPAANADTPAAPADGAVSAVPFPTGMPYSYNADGRRDPFVNLIAPTTTETAKAAPRPTGSGLGAIRVEDLSVRGIMQGPQRLVAMIQGPDNRTYLIHQGDKLADGAVKRATLMGAPKLVPEDDELLDVEPFGELCLMSE